MFGRKRKVVVPRKGVREITEHTQLLRSINTNEKWARALDEREFLFNTKILEKEYARTKKLDALIPKAFALVREAARRTLGERLFDVQLLGGIILHQGRIAEMKTGEGKTLTSTTAAYLNSLTGNPVHIVTVNDYLARRDALWMRPVFEYLGKTTSYIVSGQDNETKKSMYEGDIVYATNNELGFDYLRDNLRIEKEAISLRGYHYCIVDEIDSVLIDEARTPLIISGPSVDDTKKYVKANAVVPFLVECKKQEGTDRYPDEDREGDYTLNLKSKSVSFTTEGIHKIENVLLQKKYIVGDLNSLENFEYLHYITQCVRAHTLFSKDVDYIVSRDKKVEIVDEFTGRVLHGRRYSDGLHQAIEAKEGISIARQSRTLATITFQNFFRMYKKLSGMTGTAATEEKEFLKIYGLDVVELPTNRPVIRSDNDDLIFIDEKTKYNAIVNEIQRVYKKGQPILVGTASIENSEKLAALLARRSVPCNVLNAKHHEREAVFISKAGMRGSVTIATNMAGRGTDIKLGGNLDARIAAKTKDIDDLAEIQKVRDEEREKWQKEYEEVKSLGGLYVLGTERHESRRIDNQLRGRGGRQGDPGVSIFYLSLDDQLMKLFGGGIQRLKRVMKRGLDEGEPLHHSIITRTMERAQKNVEERNFEIRKHLLDFDSVFNKQRDIIYRQREEILQSKNLTHRIYENVEELLQSDEQSSEQETARALECAREQLMYRGTFPKNVSGKEITTIITNGIKEKVSLVGEEAFTEIVRMAYLNLIDTRWQEHVEDLENLRQAVYLRSYAQKNPLLEYNSEGFDLFQRMLEFIAISILRMIIGLRAESISEQQSVRPQISERPLNIQHKNFSLFSSRENTSNQREQSLSVSRGKKVGRNEPCPCGSGKKYKFCCGRA